MKLNSLLKKKDLSQLINSKEKFFLSYQKYLTRLHYKKCPEYNTLLRSKKLSFLKLLI